MVVKLMINGRRLNAFIASSNRICFRMEGLRVKIINLDGTHHPKGFHESVLPQILESQ